MIPATQSPTTPARAARPLTAVLAVLLALLLASPAPAQQNTTTHYGYDPQGNLTTVTDPRSLVTDHSYDALNRLTRTLQPPAAAGGARPAIRSSYDGQDRPTTITDPKNLITSYTRDGLGNLTAQNSPDSGSTTQTHDAAGNVLTRSDARGRLSWIGDGSTVTVWAYDSQGRVGAKQQIHATRQYSLLYPHDSHGRLQGIVYPSGIGVVRQYDAAGRVNALIALGTGEPQVVHYVVQFQPFGPPAGAIYGNGQPRIDVFDLDGRRYAYSRDGAYRVIGYDAASCIPHARPASRNSYAGCTGARRTDSSSAHGGDRYTTLDKAKPVIFQRTGVEFGAFPFACRAPDPDCPCSSLTVST